MAPRGSAAKRAEKAEMSKLLSRGYEPVSRDDWLMVLLASVNVLMLIARDAYSDYLPPGASQAIVGIDLAIVGVFALEFFSRMLRASSKFDYARNHAYDIVGLIPIANWWLRGFRLVRILRLYVVTHFPPEPAVERSWASSLVRGVIVHYKTVLLEEITDPIVLASIKTIQPPLERARFAETLGKSLEERRDALRYVVEEAVSNARGLSGIMTFQKGREIVHGVTDSALDAIVTTLKSDELNEVISNSIHDVLEEIKARVAEKEYALQGKSRLVPRAQPRPA